MASLSERNSVIVIGAGIAGLATAGSLAPHYDRVLLFERDRFAGAAPRRCVPQGQHIHLLLTSGRHALERIFPGLGAELLAVGALPMDVGRDLRFLARDSFKCAFDGPLRTLALSRPLLEDRIRQRVLACGNIELIADCEVAAPWYAGGRVNGVHLKSGGRHASRLVVDASGRSSHLLRWLANGAFPLPSSTDVHLGLKYVSQELALPFKPPWGMFYASGSGMSAARGGALMAVEGGRWKLTLAGYGGDHPPSDEDGMRRFATSVCPELASIIDHATTRSEPVPYNIPVMRRYHFERLRRHPLGLVALGDATTWLDPVFGQGMSVAILQAEALGKLLGDNVPLEKLASQHYATAARIINKAWVPTCVENLQRPGVHGFISRRIRVLQWYVNRIFELAAVHAEAHCALQELLHMTSGLFPVFRLPIAWRVLCDALVGRRRTPPIGHTHEVSSRQG